MGRCRVTTVNLVMILLLVVLVVYAVWRQLPAIVLLLNPAIVRCRFVDPPTGIESAIKSNEIREVVARMQSLGFRLLGIKSEQIPLWQNPVEEISLESREACVFASVLCNSRRLCYYFYTPFTSGAVVLTANAAFAEVQKDDFVQSTISTDNPGDVLSIHQRNVQRLKDSGQEPFEVYTQESRLQATRQYYSSDSVRSSLRFQGVVRLIVLLIEVLLLSVLICMLWQG